MRHLIGTAELDTIRGDANTVILDASYYLPTEHQDALAIYTAGHIPGAMFFDIDLIADHTTGLPHMLPRPPDFGAAVGSLGIGNASRVVVYDQRGIFSSARVWWMFRVFGHDDVAVLDGGLPKWRAVGRAVTDAPRHPAPAQFRAGFRPEMVRSLAQMQANVETGAALVLDARAAGRFNGSVPEPRAGMRSGHIPGAKSLPFSQLLEAGAMRPPADLRGLFNQAGVGGDRPVVTSCGSGVTAAVLSLGLAVAGLQDGAIYDGAWAEWGGRGDTKVET